MTRCILAVCFASMFACGKEAAQPREGRVDLPRDVRPPAVAPVAAAEEAIPDGTPYIPPQCYTQTRDAKGRVHNPCFTCHADAAAPNYIRDGALQVEFDFGPPARVNPWTNLFVDRSASVAAIGDDEVRAYVEQDNYAASAHGQGLTARLRSTEAWDVDGDGTFSGYVPDLSFRFDDQGFDRDDQGGYSAWRAYAYFPLPGTFWPTNGSFGDAMIRLPSAFREDANGRFDLEVYKANLALLEALITRRDVAIDATDETKWGVDLDGDGRLGKARVVRFRWRPGSSDMRWVGRAGTMLDEGRVHMAAGLFPEGTELAHSVRYLRVDGEKVSLAPRMKEFRYMVKSRWVSYGRLEQLATAEAAEKSSTPDSTRLLVGSSERGIANGAGWQLQGFIEDAGGELRPQTLAEHAFCIGCHSGVGVTDDSVFSFGRKLDERSFQKGWFHWTQRGLEGVPEPLRADGRGEYTFYLAQNGAGDELRQNAEVLERFFTSEGALIPSMAARVQRDVSTLLLPSARRALDLDKAYLVIVREQSFTRGRDATITPASNVHRVLPDEPLATGVTEPLEDRRRAAKAKHRVAPRMNAPLARRG